MDKTRGLIVFTPAESKRLIANAIASLAEVKRALRRGRIIIGSGTTNAYVVEKLTGRKIDKFWYAAGRITDGKLGSNKIKERIPPVVLIDGRATSRKPVDVLEEFTSEDVFIKGANAVDATGLAGVLMGDPRGGTIGLSIGVIMARGSHLIVPVGLEKLIPSVAAATGACGQGRFQYSMGDKVGMMPLTGSRVITELDALDVLYGVKAVHVASGGVAGSEGSVVLAIEGAKKTVQKAFESIKKIKICRKGKS